MSDLRVCNKGLIGGAKSLVSFGAHPGPPTPSHGWVSPVPRLKITFPGHQPLGDPATTEKRELVWGPETPAVGVGMGEVSSDSHML